MLLEPLAWARRHFGDLDLGHKVRNERAVKIAAAVAASPGASLPRQMGDAHQAKAAYRFLDTPDQVTFESLAGGHWAATRAGIGSMDVALLIGDTTEIDYTDHPGVVGLEPIGNGRGQGMNLHTVLAVDPARGGQVQGIAWQQLFYRQERPKVAKGKVAKGKVAKGKVAKGKAAQGPAAAAAQAAAPAAAQAAAQAEARPAKADRQSQVWADSVAGCGRPAAGKKLVHVTDSGSDDFGYFAACAAQGSDFLCRIYRHRRATLGHGAEAGEGGRSSILDLARALPALGGKAVELRGRTRQKVKVKVEGKADRSTVVRDVPARVVQLQVSAAAVSLFPPADGGYGTDPLRLWVVRVWEPHPLPGTEPIEWVLLTSLPVTGLQDALLMAEWYGHRWLIEEYHKCLKTGCRVEDRQLETADRLEALLGFLVVVAVRQLALKQQAGAHPDARATTVVDELTVTVLAAKRKLKTPPADLTVRQFWREVAKLGGFLGRKSDGEPGWQTLWLGWMELQTLVEGARLMSSLAAMN
jgi:hypothetical protein